MDNRTAPGPFCGDPWIAIHGLRVRFVVYSSIKHRPAMGGRPVYVPPGSLISKPLSFSRFWISSSVSASGKASFFSVMFVPSP